MKLHKIAATLLLVGLIGSPALADYHTMNNDNFADKVRTYSTQKFDQVLQPGFKKGLIRHVVLFDLKQGITKQERRALTGALKNLRKSARTDEGIPYIEALEIGQRNISREGVGQGFDFMFTVTFKSLGDRNFYVGQDGVHPRPDSLQPFDEHLEQVDRLHAAFKNFVGPLLNGNRPDGSPPVIVFDYKF